MANETNRPDIESNLPLLFAGGYPTSLEKITETQLEKFIPFMVQCSLGNIQINDAKYSEPEWWPATLPFSIPLQRPTYATDWHDRLKSIVTICYSFHKCTYLLRFCKQLASYQLESLRFVANYNNTTSLYERASNNLLVTFRNENMTLQLYDQASVTRPNQITLMSSKKTNSQSKIIDKTVDTVEPVFEIYFCNNCEAELYSKDAYEEHEKICQEDDDVIFCGEEFLTDPLENKFEEQALFLENFSLVNPKLPLPIRVKSPIKKYVVQSSSGVKRCNGIVSTSNIPFSSPAGQQLQKSSKSHLTHSDAVELVERYERYCGAPPMGRGSLSNWIKPIKYNRIPVTYRGPEEQTYRRYTFPRRQYYQYRFRQALPSLNNDELQMYRPMKIELTEMSINDIEALNSENRCKGMVENDGRAIDQSAVVDMIDLCSDDDDDEVFSSNHHDDFNVSQTAITPASTIALLIEPLQTPFEMWTSEQSTMSMFDEDRNYRYQHDETHQSFLNGAQGSVVTSTVTDISLQATPSAAEEAHISMNLRL